MMLILRVNKGGGRTVCAERDEREEDEAEPFLSDVPVLTDMLDRFNELSITTINDYVTINNNRISIDNILPGHEHSIKHKM